MSKSILVAEDDRVLAEIMRFNLEMFGLEVTNAFDGQTACQLVTTKSFDAIVTDFQMPRKNGAEVCEAVRSSELNRNTALFVCTAKGYELDTKSLQTEFGVRRFFLKPFSPRELVSQVSQAIASPETQGTTGV